ncbi:hypothetical protein [Paragemmobacter straminiformis]|uniref:Uncharacterized protein n=1 Tax=Paragemmobacter straminiformis TaxID=2045119 RepID=A0A842IC63_9RHOB|nr:hypothetical protein [Gemmobacter straminiformis]MBC2837612.1 hypothetical protein [Gemmobacter straminiformis]
MTKSYAGKDASRPAATRGDIVPFAASRGMTRPTACKTVATFDSHGLLCDVLWVFREVMRRRAVSIQAVQERSLRSCIAGSDCLVASVIGQTLQAALFFLHDTFLTAEIGAVSASGELEFRLRQVARQGLRRVRPDHHPRASDAGMWDRIARELDGREDFCAHVSLTRGASSAPNGLRVVLFRQQGQQGW